MNTQHEKTSRSYIELTGIISLLPLMIGLMLMLEVPRAWSQGPPFSQCTADSTDDPCCDLSDCGIVGACSESGAPCAIDGMCPGEGEVCAFVPEIGCTWGPIAMAIAGDSCDQLADPVEQQMCDLGIVLDGNISDAISAGAVLWTDLVSDPSANSSGVFGDGEAPRLVDEPNGFNIASVLLLLSMDSNPLDAVDDSFLYVGIDITDLVDGDGQKPVPFDSDDDGSACRIDTAIVMDPTMSVTETSLEQFSFELESCRPLEDFGEDLESLMFSPGPLKTGPTATLSIREGFDPLQITSTISETLLSSLSSVDVSGVYTNPTNACIDAQLHLCGIGNDIEFVIPRAETSSNIGFLSGASPDSVEARLNRFALSQLFTRVQAQSAGDGGPEETAKAALLVPMPEIDVSTTVRCLQRDCRFTDQITVMGNSVVEFEVQIRNSGTSDLDINILNLLTSESEGAIVSPICESLQAYYTSPQQGIWSEHVTPGNARGLAGLDPTFFSDICANLDLGFLGSIRNRITDSIGDLDPVLVGREDKRCVIQEGASLRLRFLGLVSTNNGFCVQAVSEDIVNTVKVDGVELGGVQVMASDIPGAIDTNAEALLNPARDDNEARINVVCCGPFFDDAPLLEDCNSNQERDECDIFTGASTDCDANAIPDECDIAKDASNDCNDNGLLDQCEITDGTVQDCNTNLVPDMCDLIGGSSADCNANDVPDECDIETGFSEDCNSSGVPDSCELQQGGPDCNTNGVLDECDIASGQSDDCNMNGVPDACDIASEASADCNGNAIPDECDIADCAPDDPSCRDCQPDGVPDGCQQSGEVYSFWVGGTPCQDPPTGCSAKRAPECWETQLQDGTDPNWCPEITPDNFGNSSFDVELLWEADVRLNISPTIRVLAIADSATLKVDDCSGANVRTLTVEAQVFNRGLIQATDRERLTIDTPLISQGDCGDCEMGCSFTGTLEAFDGDFNKANDLPGDKSILEINGARVVGGSVRATGIASEVHLIGGAVLDDVCVRGVVVPDGQIGGFSGELTNSGVLAVAPSGGQSALFAPALEGGSLIGDGGMDDCVRLGGQTTARLGDFRGSFQNAANHRIDGAGVVFGGFDNQGTIEANAGANGQLIITSPGNKLNAGILTARGSGVLRLNDEVSQEGKGRIESHDGGLVLVAANVAGTGGMRTVGGTIRVEGVSVQLANCIQTCPPYDPAVGGGIELLGATVTANTPGAPNDLDMAGGVVSLALSSNVTLAGPARLCPPARGTAALTINDSAFSCGDWFQCAGGQLSVTSGTFTVAGDFLFSNTESAEIGWGRSSSLRMTGGVGLPNDDPSCYARLEVGGSRASKGVRGSTTAGGDFVIDRLIIGPGAHVSLVDLFDNGNRLECPSGKIIDESLTVNHLIFEDEAGRLNTSGLNFSYQQLEGLESQIISLAPEPVDFDADGDVDLEDVQQFLNCLPMTPLDYGCRVFDTDGDDQLSLVELQGLLNVFTGPLTCPNAAP